MPLTNPAYPIGPYRFRNREYLIVTYRTDPHKLREVVPEPLQVREPLVNFEFIRMPTQRVSATTQKADKSSRFRCGAARAATATACFLTTTRPLPADARCGVFQRS